MSGRPVRAELELRCDATLTRAMLAVARRDRRETAIDPLIERLATVEEALARCEEEARPLAELAALLELDTVALDFLWTAIAVTVDPRIAIHAEALAGSAGRRGLTVALFEQLVELAPAAGRALALALAGPSPLVGEGLLVCAESTAILSQRPYLAPPRLVAHVAGAAFVDPRLTLARPRSHHDFDEAQRRSLAALATVLDQPAAVVVVEGPIGGGRSSAIAHAAGRAVAVLDAAELRGAALDDAVLALRREASLVDTVPVIDNVDGLDAEALRQIGRALDHWPATIALTAATPSLDIGTRRPLVRVAWPVPDTSTRARLWQALGGAPAGAPVDALAARYPVGPGAIARAVASARLLRPGLASLDAVTLAAGLRHNIAERLGGVARRIEVTQSWDELVLADDARDQVSTLIARLRHAHHVLDRWGYRHKLARGGGVAALLSGPPGTGKTMVAGLIARELDLELYQVDLSQVVSKWVGETEKQLARVFDVAEQGHALLLFDEADALFGQRTVETRGAVDRYANLEVNFLLQRVESFGGVTILTTNLDTAIDAALKRRLAAHIVFDLPDEDERVKLWQRLITTADAPLSPDLDPEPLARDFPKMSGANIRNAALAAAFLAAADGAPAIAQEHLQRAARVEYRSMGHVLADRRAR